MVESQPRKIRTLLVDDAEFMLRQAGMLLASYACIEVVATARDGEQAIQCARLHQPELILMDVQMPRCHGLQAAEVIRRESPRTRIVLYTTHDTSQLAPFCTGADFVISKIHLVRELCRIFDELFDLPCRT